MSLVDLGPSISEAEKRHFAADSVGPSWQSYWYGSGLWALPIDAATQVASYRPDLLRALSPAVPDTFDDVLELGERARKAGKYIVVPACPTDAISLFFTLSANLGYPIPEEGEHFVDDSVGAEVLDRLHALIATGPSPLCGVESDPGLRFHDQRIRRSLLSVRFWLLQLLESGQYGAIEVHECSGGRPARMCRARCWGERELQSASSVHIHSEAIAYAKWLVSPEHQRGTYFREGGQPASLAAWTDSSVNAMADGFFSGTLQTLQTAYLRPRFDGFVRFFEAAGIQINRCLRGEVNDAGLDPMAERPLCHAASCSSPNRVTTKEEPVKNPNPDPAKHKEISIWNAENWLYEDFEVGKRARSIRRTISEGESMLFNAIVLDMHPYVADDVFAKEEGVFKKRLVAGAMVFSLGLGLMAHNNIHTFSYGYDKLRFIKPVFVGDTIYTLRTQLEKWPKYAEMGMVKVSYEVFKMPGELVLYCEHLQTVNYRDPANFNPQPQQE